MKQLLFGSIITLLVACGGQSSDNNTTDTSQKENVDTLLQSVLDDHDVAMGKMGKLKGARNAADKKVDSVRQSGSKADTAKYATLSRELKTAEDNMNTWMHEFSLDSASENTDKRIQYLNSEKMKVSKVKDEILSVLAKADTLLKK